MAARAAAIALMATIAAVTAAPLTHRAASTTATATPVGTPPVVMLSPLARHRRGGYNGNKKQPLYAFGTCMPSGSYTTDECCPAGYNVAGITSESECKTAFESISSDPWGGNAPRTERPSGCFQYTGNTYGHWNPNNVVGNAMVGDDKTICKLISAKCAGNPATYDAGYGGCSTYAVGHNSHNNGYCATDTNAAGEVAENVCRECGACTTGAACETQPGVDYPKQDLFSVPWSSAKKCQDKCLATSACTHFTFIKKHGNMCYLKKGKKNHPKPFPGATSGACGSTPPAKACDSVGDICSGTGTCKSGCPCPMCVTTPAPTTTITSGSTTTTTTTTTTTLMPWHPSNCPIYPYANYPDTCWGNTAYQVCPADRSGAWHAVMKHRGNQKAMHDAYLRLTATGVGCTIAKTPEYDHHPKKCVSGHNIKHYSGKTVQECKSICDKTAGCVAFEYGVAYGGVGGYTPGQCQPQSSANKAGCDGAYHNLDLYVKQ